MASLNATIGTSGSSGHWVGVLREGRTVVASCPHLHKNRDSGQSPARRCAEQLLRAATHPEFGSELVGMLESKEIKAAEVARSLGARISNEEKLARLHKSLRAFGWKD